MLWLWRLQCDRPLPACLFSCGREIQDRAESCRSGELFPHEPDQMQRNANRNQVWTAHVPGPHAGRSSLKPRLHANRIMARAGLRMTLVKISFPQYLVKQSSFSLSFGNKTLTN